MEDTMQLRQYMMGCTTCGDLSFNTIPDHRFDSEQEAIDNFRACIELLAVRYSAMVRYFTEGSTHYWHIESGDTLHVYMFQWLPEAMDTYYREREAEHERANNTPDIAESIKRMIRNLDNQGGINLN
jgi:hypothetical protein